MSENNESALEVLKSLRNELGKLMDEAPTSEEAEGILKAKRLLEKKLVALSPTPNLDVLERIAKDADYSSEGKWPTQKQFNEHYSAFVANFLSVFDPTTVLALITWIRKVDPALQTTVDPTQPVITSGKRFPIYK